MLKGENTLFLSTLIFFNFVLLFYFFIGTVFLKTIYFQYHRVSPAKRELKVLLDHLVAEEHLERTEKLDHQVFEDPP